MGGVFLLLACYQVLPHGINAMSGMGAWGQVIGYSTVGAGLVTTAIISTKKCFYKNNIQPSDVKKNSKEMTENPTTAPTSQAMRHTSSSEERGIAATTLQKYCRGYLARKRVKEIERSVLSYSLFAQAQCYTQDLTKLQQQPTAPHGNNRKNIYMPKELPVVIRVCNDEQDFSRLAKMRQALAICHQHNFQHVVVPKARLQGKFIIEQKLTDKNASIIKGMAFYYANREFYEQAVREFTAFLCHGRLNDITGNSRHILNYQKIACIPRFDNLLLYRTEHEEESVYNIGIIDIETFKLNSSTPTPNEVDYALRTSIELFPYHFDAVIEVGRNFATLSNEDIEQLRQQSLKSLELYKTFCENLKTPTLIELNVDRKQELKQHIGIFLLNMHRVGLNDYPGAKNCLHDDPHEKAMQFETEIFPKMIDLVTKKLNTMLKTLSKLPPPISYGEQLEKRIIGSDITCKLVTAFEDDKVYEEAETIFKQDKNPHTVFALFEEILNQLVIGGELSYYKAQVYGRSDLIFF